MAVKRPIWQFSNQSRKLTQTITAQGFIIPSNLLLIPRLPGPPSRVILASLAVIISKSNQHKGLALFRRFSIVWHRGCISGIAGNDTQTN
jgi:hypothetical protein